MPPAVVARETIRVGTPVVIDGSAPASGYSAVFEDDGATGYFYGLDRSHNGNPILDALHVYNVDSVVIRSGHQKSRLYGRVTRKRPSCLSTATPTRFSISRLGEAIAARAFRRPTGNGPRSLMSGPMRPWNS